MGCNCGKKVKRASTVQKLKQPIVVKSASGKTYKTKTVKVKSNANTKNAR